MRPDLFSLPFPYSQTKADFPVLSGWRDSNPRSYLCSFFSGVKIPGTVSMELINKVTGNLETMTERLLPPRKKPGSAETNT
jgi:hypothetical protein